MPSLAYEIFTVNTCSKMGEASMHLELCQQDQLGERTGLSFDQHCYLRSHHAQEWLFV